MRDIVDEKITEQAAMYALGMLSQSEARAFEHSLNEGQEDYAGELAAFDAVVAALAFGAPERRPPEMSRNRLLITITSEAETTEIPVVRNPQFHNVRLEDGEWVQFAEGVSIKKLYVDHNSEAVTSLVKLDPGARLPRRRQAGIEENVVIEGDCRVNGEILKPGDYRRGAAGTIDGEVTTEHGTIFLMISRRDAELSES